MVADSSTPSSDTPLAELLDEFQIASAEWAVAGVVGKERSVKRTLAAKSAIESAFSKLREENEQIRKFEHDAATDLSGTWEEVRRLRSSSLTPEEAKAVVDCLNDGHDQENVHLGPAILKLRSLGTPE